MKALRWAGALFLVAGIAAAPLNLLHAHFFSGAEIARVPLPLSSTTSGANSSPGKPRAPQVYPPLIINLDPAQSPVVVLLEAAYVLGQGSPGTSNRYTTHLISGSSITAKGDAVLEASGTASEPRMTTLTLLRAKINAPGLYSVLLSEAVAPGIALTSVTLTVSANARRADMVNVLAGFAFMLIGAVTLFATGKRRAR